MRTPPAQSHDLPALLRDWNEATRHQYTGVRMTPPNQSLHAQQAARSEIHNRWYSRKNSSYERPAISDSSRSRSCNTSCICGSNHRVAFLPAAFA